MSYSLIQAAKYIEKKPFDLVRMLSSNELPYDVVDSRVLIEQQALDNYLERILIDDDVTPSIAEPIVSVSQVPEPLPSKPSLNDTQQPSELYIPEILSTVLGDKAEIYIRSYGVKKSTDLIEELVSYSDEETAISLFAADNKDTIINYSSIQRYFSKLTALVFNVSEKCSDVIPDYFDIIKSPHNFLPNSISTTQKKLNIFEDIKPKNGAIDSETKELADLVNLDPNLVKGLQDEGHNVAYLDSMLRKGLSLDGSRPSISEQYLPCDNWRNSVLSYLKSINVRHTKKNFKAEEKKLDQLGLFQFHKEGRHKGC
ncbi:hypothetical protein HN662_04790, partial [Candidatus Woesearchaeota archaeon]|nr:hypothetical protein [Candidatus Woesearchaeota archaeon]